MPDDQATRHIARYDKLKSKRANFDNLCQEVAEFCLPHRQNITSKREAGARQTDRVMDITAPHAVEILAASIAGSVTSPALEWFHLALREERLNEDHGVKVWLEDAEQEMYLAFRQSNFHDEVDQMYQDLIAFGTGCLFMGQKPDLGQGFPGLLFHCVPWGEYVVQESPDGKVDTVYRCYEMTADQIVRKWPGDAGEQVTEKHKESPDEPYEVLHCVYPRATYNPESKSAKDMPFAELYIVKKHAHILAEGGFDELPYAVPRWSKTSGEVYGRGPAMLAQPGNRTLNRARELMLRAAAKNIDPPVEAPHDGIIGELQLFAGGINTVVGSEPGKPAIKALETGSKLDWSQFVMADERGQIRDVFFIEQLQLPQKSNMTATEVERHYERMRRILGARLSRLESEFLNPLIDRVFLLMARANSFGEYPSALLAYAQQTGEQPNLDVEYEGPLSRSQRSARFQAVMEVIGMVQQVAAVSPDTAVKMLDNVDIDEMFRDVAGVRGFPTEYLNEQDTIEQIRAGRVKAQEQQAQLEQGAMLAEAAGKAAPMLRELKPKEAAA